MPILYTGIYIDLAAKAADEPRMPLPVRPGDRRDAACLVVLVAPADVLRKVLEIVQSGL